jgi:hypothetical protein
MSKATLLLPYVIPTFLKFCGATIKRFKGKKPKIWSGVKLRPCAPAMFGLIFNRYFIDCQKMYPAVMPKSR